MTLLLAAPAHAHELTEKQAKNALKPIAEELIATVGPVIAQKLPGATITKSRRLQDKESTSSGMRHCVLGRGCKHG